MKAILLMFDSLCRHKLPVYGCREIHAPNFQRLAERSVTFTNAYGGSMPCMPARRELHTGRYNFLHRSWGPLEPFDDSMPEILKNHGIHSRLVSDHYHYWEDGGATYHTRYSSWSAIRGQEGDPWKVLLDAPPMPPTLNNPSRPGVRRDWVNRQFMRQPADWPQARTMAEGLDFLETHHACENWFLHIETFDPHEPFFSPESYHRLYPDGIPDLLFDWPSYGPVKETRAQVAHLRARYAALVSMCDDYLGKILDAMDRLDLWRDTLLIVNTDHGFMLGERGDWGKVVCPWYNELIHLPLFIWDPRCGRRGEPCDCLVQTIDLAPTVLDFFGISPAPDMLGRPLTEALRANRTVRETALFGDHGAQVGCTDGRFVYLRAPAMRDDQPVYEYTLMPTHMKAAFSPEELQNIALHEPFTFTKGCRTMRIPARQRPDACEMGTLLFDLAADPRQQSPICGTPAEDRMIRLLVRAMREADAPVEQYERLGLPRS